MLDSITLDLIAQSLPPEWRPLYKAASAAGVIDDLLALQPDFLAFLRAFPLLVGATQQLSADNLKTLNFSVFTVDFTVPDLTVSNPAAVTSTAWMNVGDVLSIGPATNPVLDWQLLQVDSILDANNFGLTNIGALGASTGSVVATGGFIKLRVPA